MSENTSQKSKKVPAVAVEVDGSAGAKEALRWALEQTRLGASPVQAVQGWSRNKHDAGTRAMTAGSTPWA